MASSPDYVDVVFKPSTSPIWHHFKKSTKKNVKKAQCKYCGDQISNDGTTAMRNHIKQHPEEVEKVEEKLRLAPKEPTVILNCSLFMKILTFLFVQ